MIDLDQQFHILGWITGAPAAGLQVIDTCRNRHHAIAFAKERDAMLVVDTEDGRRIWAHPHLLKELKAATADLDARRRRSHSLALKYRAQMQRTTERAT
jgi:hypothetical protein